MANYRLVNTGMWDDNWFSNLDYTERYLFLYFLTNPLTNIAGVYEVPLKRIVYDTGVDQEMVKKLVQRFTADGKLFYELGFVVLKNWFKHQHLNPNQTVAAINKINSLPLWLRTKLLDVKDPMYLDMEAFLNASVSLTNPLLTLEYISSAKNAQKTDAQNNSKSEMAADSQNESLTKPFATREVKEKRSERESVREITPPTPTNPRAAGTNPRAQGSNPRGAGTPVGEGLKLTAEEQAALAAEDQRTGGR